MAVSTFLCPPGTRHSAPTISNTEKNLLQSQNFLFFDRPRIFVRVIEVLRLCAMMVMALGWTSTCALPSCVSDVDQ